MGKTVRCFRWFLVGKKERSASPDAKPAKEKKKKKKKWICVRSFKDRTTTKSSLQAQVNGDDTDRRRGRSSYREESPSYSCSHHNGSVEERNKHAVAVATATAAVAEAAVAAAQAAAAVVRLTNSSSRWTSTYGHVGKQEERAAVKIQAAFRGYLARKALQALKGLVSIQALVRGYIVRKGLAKNLRCLQASVRAQARARANRSQNLESRYAKSKHLSSHNPGRAMPEKHEYSIRAYNPKHDRSSPPLKGPATPEKHEYSIRAYNARQDRSSPRHKRNSSRSKSRDSIHMDRMPFAKNHVDHWIDECLGDHHQRSSVKTMRADDEKSEKILEIDTGKPQSNTKRKKNVCVASKYGTTLDRNSHSFTTLDSPKKNSTAAQLFARGSSSGEIQPTSPLKFCHEVDDAAFCTAIKSPRYFSSTMRPASAKRVTFTPTKRERSRSYFSGYSSDSRISGNSDYPNYSMANAESPRAKVRSQSTPKQRPEFDKSSSMKRFSVPGSGDTRSSAQRALAQHAKIKEQSVPRLRPVR
ncbi:hypothetical protein NE237_030878 [Protea cynaroides]|uniref:DUF4005 domain-containing protein n=1 Tax=Protea cynaroides TaxID=273540 RepID=A0A9Q0JW73_9MAGN|nr:hypothetical protein NE237_030878 [Protea cynaroides]